MLNIVNRYNGMSAVLAGVSDEAIRPVLHQWAWVDPIDPQGKLDVIDPSIEEAFAEIALGGRGDVDRAVAAASAAFDGFYLTTPAERLDLLKSVLSVYQKRAEDLAWAISHEMGAPKKMALENQVGSGGAHIRTMIDVMKDYRFER